LERKILLVEPPFQRLYKYKYSLNKLPLSLAYLAGSITQNYKDWDVKIYNAEFSQFDSPLDLNEIVGKAFQNYLDNLQNFDTPIWQDIKKVITEFNPSIVGITAKSQNFASACVIAKIVKSIDSKIVTIVGGPHASMVKTEILEDPSIDYAVYGEGEETILDLIEVYEGKKDPQTVDGLVYRNAGQVITNPQRKLISNLDNLPFPSTVAKKMLWDYEKYPSQSFKYLFATRGCPYNCSFCGSRNIWGAKVRFRSVENIIEEIRELQNMGINYLHFDDDTFGIKKSFIRDLCSAIKTEFPKLNWSCEIHVKLIDDENISIMKSAGCRTIFLGIESGNDEMLKRIRKNITISEARDAVKIIKKHGIYLQTFFIVGFPEETIESLDDTISAIMSFPVDSVIYSIFTPYKGTEMFEYCKDRGIVADNFDPAKYNHQGPENYFCPNIAEDIFKTKVRKLEKMLDKINSRRRLKMYFSREGFLKVKEKGLLGSISRVVQICRNSLRS
jgi:anaerobic magnesium-protoporphyrin IX monomethyl ester cyclase